MSDLYSILGARRNWSHAAIKKAYHKKAMKHHPDRGGSAEVFQEVQLAWEVLGDSDRKKRYDETGSYDTGPSDPQHGAAIQVIIQHFRVFIDTPRSTPILRVDAVAAMKATIEANLKRNEGVVSQIIKRISMLKSVAERMLPAGDNALREIALADCAALETQLKATNDSVAVHKRALTILSGYSFRTDANNDASGLFKIGSWRMSASC